MRKPSPFTAFLASILAGFTLSGAQCGGTDPFEQGACVPVTCDWFGRFCGPLDDGCGGLLDCGICGLDEECGDDGRCLPRNCEPTTCAAQQKDCGTISDGCRKRLKCGTCADGAVCGVQVDNVCATPPAACTSGAWTGYADRFFRANCNGCHSEYASRMRVVSEEKLRKLIDTDDMPRGRTLSATEKRWILNWIDCGYPE